MNIKVSGNGSVPSGEYEHVSLHGNVQLFGLIKCSSIVARGKARGERLECKKKIKASGTATFSGKVTAQDIKASGRYSFGSDVIASNTLRLAGNVKCTGDMKAETLFASGALSVGSDMEAEKLKVKGSLQCEGLLNAEEAEIKFNSNTRLGTVGGNKITIRLKTDKKIWQCICIFPLFIKKWRARTRVNIAVEGNDIAIEHTICPRVTGKTVHIGRGCKIDLVQYSDEVKISPNSKVGRVEKI